MKLLQIVQKPQRRGAEIFAYELSRHIRGLGVEVRTVYLYTYPGAKPLALECGDVCLHGAAASRLERLPGLHFHLLRRLLDEIRRFAPDIVQVNGSRTVKYGAAAKWVANGHAGWKLVYRNIDMPKYWNKRAYAVAAYRKLLMPQMDGVIGVSNASLAQAIDLYRMSVPAVAIPNGIDVGKLDHPWDRTDARRALGAGDDDFVVLFVGSLVRQKRPDRFLNVLRNARSRVPRLKGWVVGDGPLRGAVAAQIAEQLPADCCTLFGYQDDVGRFLRAADALMITSDTEGIPAVVLEAGYMRLPAIVTGVGALAECIRHGETGLIVEPPFERNLADAIVRIARHPDIRRTMGARARQTIEDGFTMSSVAGRYHAFYQDILHI